jgi:RecA/RadA recombinase
MAVKNSNYLKNLKREYEFKIGCSDEDFDEVIISYPTPYPSLNFMLSGDFFGGLQTNRGYMLCGEASSFKSNVALACVASVLSQNPNAIFLGYDSESVITKDNLEKFGINLDQVVKPRKFYDPDELGRLVLNDTLNIIQAKGNEDKTFILVIDGIGQIGTTTEINRVIEDDTSPQPAVRAKKLNEVARHLLTVINNHNVILITVNHSYQSIGGLYQKSIPSGGTGFVKISDSVILMSSKNISAEKDEETKVSYGSTFMMKALKSRSISKDFSLPLDVSYDSGILPYSGLFDLLQRMSKHLKQVTQQKYSLITENGEILEYNGKFDFKKSEVEHSTDFWRFVFKNTSFAQEIKDKVSLKEKKLIDEKALASWSLINEMSNNK